MKTSSLAIALAFVISSVTSTSAEDEQLASTEFTPCSFCPGSGCPALESVVLDDAALDDLSLPTDDIAAISGGTKTCLTLDKISTYTPGGTKLCDAIQYKGDKFGCCPPDPTPVPTRPPTPVPSRPPTPVPSRPPTPVPSRPPTPVPSRPPTPVPTRPPTPDTCTLTPAPDFSDCDDPPSNNFCCAVSNAASEADLRCVNKISGEPCGQGPAQLDMCGATPSSDGMDGVNPCSSDQQCCKDSNTNGDFCCVPLGIDCTAAIFEDSCVLPAPVRDNILLFLIGLILLNFGNGANRRNLRSAVDKQGMEDIMAKVASVLSDDEGKEDIMAKVSESVMDEDMMTELANAMGN